MNKTALLTGVTGFIGRHLAERLLEQGWQVHAIVRKNSNIGQIEETVREKIIFHIHDEKTDLRKIVKAAEPEVVFHLASLFLASHAYEDISRLIDSNIKFSVQLLEAMAVNDVYRLVNTGTSWQHYKNENYNPVNLYAASKQAFEVIMKYYQETIPLQVIDLKLYDTYGPDDTRKKLFSLLDKIAQTGETLAMSKGEQLIDLVHVDDVVDAFLLSAKYLLENKYRYRGEYAVTSGIQISLKKIVEEYEKFIGKKINIIWGGRPYREREVMIPWNNGRILPGWKIKKTGCAIFK